MCGIIGITGKRQVAPLILSGLKHLEYRGYDSAGVAVGGKRGLQIAKRKGRVRELDELKPQRFKGTFGIAHTRWATHGAPTIANAHPHATDRVAVVHNGIIENFRELRDDLAQDGANFESETDTEVIAALLDSELGMGKEPLVALKATLDQLKGAYALGVLIEGEDAPPYKNGLPDYVRLKNTPVAKKLPGDFKI